MAIRAAFFDVGDTLVEHWIGPQRTNELLREALRREFGEREWYERFLEAEVAPRGDSDLEAVEDAEEARLRQERCAGTRTGSATRRSASTTSRWIGSASR